MLHRELFTREHLKLIIVPIQLSIIIRIETILILDISHLDQGIITTNEPAVIHLSFIKLDDHVVATFDSRECCCSVSNSLLTYNHWVWLEQLIPEKRLHRAEVQSTVTKEINLHPWSLQILFVDTVHDKHIILCHLNTSCLNKPKGHQLQTDNVITLHLEVSCKSKFLSTYFN